MRTFSRSSGPMRCILTKPLSNSGLTFDEFDFVELQFFVARFKLPGRTRHFAFGLRNALVENFLLADVGCAARFEQCLLRLQAA